jgi:hypothetical protein
MDFFGGLDFETEEARQLRFGGLRRDRRRIERRVVVGHGDSAHAGGFGARDDFAGRHCQIRTGTEAGMDMQIEFHFSAGAGAVFLPL